MRSTGSSRSGSSRVQRETGNPRTVGRRYDPRALTEVLVRAAGDVRLRQPFREAQVLATGGFAARLARERGLLLRAAPVERGRRARLRPRPRRRRDRRDGRVLRARAARARWRRTSTCAPPSSTRATRSCSTTRAATSATAAWHESDIVQRFPGGAAWYVVDARALREPVRERTVADLVEAAREAGGDVRPAEKLPFALPALRSSWSRPSWRSRVYAGVTHTIGGLRIDDRARVLDARRHAARRPLRGGRRRGRDLHRRLRQRARGRPRLRPDRRRDRARLGELRVRAGAAVARERRRADLADPQQRLVRLDRRADGRDLAVALAAASSRWTTRRRAGARRSSA